MSASGSEPNRAAIVRSCPHNEKCGLALPGKPSTSTCSACRASADDDVWTAMRAMADELEALRARWFGLRAHITRIADAGARNDERQKVFEELRDIIVRLEGAE